MVSLRVKSVWVMRALMSEESFGGDIKCEKLDGGSGDRTAEWFNVFLNYSVGITQMLPDIT